MSTITRTLGTLPAPAWYRPWLRFIDPVDGPQGGDPKPNDDDDKNLGFPKDTPIDQMTPEQQAAYWKNQSKTQQKAREDAEREAGAYKKFGSVDELQSAADAAEQARLAALDDNQKALEAARAEGKAEGAKEHGGKHLAAAVKGMLIAHTKGAHESFEDALKRVSGAIEFADLTKFIGDDGDLDAAKVQTFAKSIGSTDSDGNGSGGGFPLFDAMQRQGLPTPGGTGSVAAIEQQAYDRLTSKQ